MATSSDKSSMSYRHFKRFCNGKCKFGELTLKLGERYMKYLTTQARAMKPRYERLETNTSVANGTNIQTTGVPHLHSRTFVYPLIFCCDFENLCAILIEFRLAKALYCE